mmetsp:Transcript_8916/g.16512  ORF Transcript_8916/g.16512 Transcript_8916/m.16512 type:complete len:274 (-) Transcript_8916:125-946(-)|eukprot:CAMPEP_0115102158 /NCGR_PEP_ID=MMETSP0227-20121206/33709_1 /TAXON_ID=89957 /ORGANISM="Polarella glacialis, Strain CCMP 1383" /LENGTH=273 /DNA_ID=CAMNT_0002498143 /DNA_START=51 /DNA_END=872 /DNA_ORIENTATION=-
MGKGDTIDPEKDPEKYEQYLKDREEKNRLERKQKKAQDEREAQVKKMKVAGADAPLKVGVQVMVVGLQNHPEKNGSIGTAFQFLKDKDRWQVEFASGASNNFKAENLQVMEDSAASGGSTTAEDESDIPTSKIYISNLSADTTEQNLVSLFSGIGALAKEPVRNAKGNTKGYADEWPYAAKLYKPGKEAGDGCVEFVDKCSARAAIKSFNGHFLKGNTIGVAYATGGEIKVDTRTPDERERSRERREELGKLTKKLKEEKGNPLLAGIFGPSI